MSMETTRTVAWTDGGVVLLDQTALPAEERYITCETPERVARAIGTLEVRGAPAIGVAGAMGVALAAVRSTAADAPGLLAELDQAGRMLIATRPTAVNLAWAVERVLDAARRAAADGPDAVRRVAVDTATWLAEDDLARCRAIGDHGAPLIDGVGQVLTHCNAGALATVGYGTALGVIRSAFRDNPALHVWVDETRPVFQGARITAFELARDGIANTVIADGVAASLMARGEVQAAVVGADRIAANGDTANQIGTYSVAVNCKHHGIPFYVAAPLSTVDPTTPTGAGIVVEERDPDEVRRYRGELVTPFDAAVHNPAFDVTPAALIAGIVTEVGVLRPPYEQSIREAFERLPTPGSGRGHPPESVTDV
jgi:methylthioribose-1-phosphate isomerase